MSQSTSAVIFDMDGVLTDSEPIINAAAVAMFQELGVTVRSDDFLPFVGAGEDRYIGGMLNPFGIDLAGVLKIPITTITHSIAARRPTLGVGGSTLPMQFARVIYKTPPHAGEGGITKLRRKLGEWWLAPVIYRELTRGGDDTLLKQWAANHIWLARENRAAARRRNSTIVTASGTRSVGKLARRRCCQASSLNDPGPASTAASSAGMARNRVSWSQRRANSASDESSNERPFQRESV